MWVRGILHGGAYNFVHGVTLHPPCPDNTIVYTMAAVASAIFGLAAREVPLLL